MYKSWTNDTTFQLSFSSLWLQIDCHCSIFMIRFFSVLDRALMYLRLLDTCGVLFGVMFSVLVYDAGRLNDNRAVYKQSYNL